jgi:flagellar FliL protein
MAENETTPAVANSGLSRLVIVGLLVGIVSAAAAAGGVYFIISSQNEAGEATEASADEEAQPAGPPLYFELDPPFVVNLAGQNRSRFLQASVQLMSRDEKVVEALEEHQPLLRNNLVMLLSSATVEEVATREGKEALRQAALEEARKVLESEGEPAGVEQVYFTAFVVQ